MRRPSISDLRSESGLALVIAIVVTWIVFLLATVVLAGAVHNALSARRSWKRLGAVSAAESGIMDYLATLESPSTKLASLRTGGWSGSTNTWQKTLALAGDPGSSVILKAEYFSDSGLASPFNLGSVLDKDFPATVWARLTSTAYTPSNCVPGSGHCVVRKMQAKLELAPERQNLRGAFAGLFVCELGQSLKIKGATADMYFMGSAAGGVAAACPTGDDLIVSTGQLRTDGSVYVLNGSAKLSASTYIKGNLYAKTGLSLGTTGGTGVCATTNPAKVLVCGNASSGGPIPLAGGGTQRVLGSTTAYCSGCSPGSVSFPVIEAASYPVTTAPPTLTSKGTNKVTLASGVYKSSTDSTCSYPTRTVLDFPKTVVLSGDVTFVSRCGFVIKNPVTFTATSGTPLISFVTLYTPVNCLSTGEYRDASLESNVSTEPYTARLFFYTPCALNVENRLDIAGALVAGTVSFRNNTTIDSVDVPLTGSAAGVVAGFRQRVLWMREVR